MRESVRRSRPRTRCCLRRCRRAGGGRAVGCPTGGGASRSPPPAASHEVPPRNASDPSSSPLMYSPRQAELIPHGLEELTAVSGVAQDARGDEEAPRRAVGLEARRVARQAGVRSCHGVLVQPTGLVDSLAETDDGGQPLSLLRAAGRHVREEQAAGVGAEVDPRRPSRRGLPAAFGDQGGSSSGGRRTRDRPRRRGRPHPARGPDGRARARRGRAGT